MSVLYDVLKYKLQSIADRKKHISATVLNTKIDKTASVRQHCRIYDSMLGRYTYVARNTLIQNTEIGAFCSISEGCNIGMPEHPTTMASTSPVFLDGGNYLSTNLSNYHFDDCPRTQIGNDVWVGAGAKIKSGLIIGNGAIIAAGAVVTKDVPPYSIVGGVPARIIRYRFDESTISQLEMIRWWDLSDDILEKLGPYVDSPERFCEEVGKQNGKI